MKFSRVNTREIHPAYQAFSLSGPARLPYKQALMWLLWVCYSSPISLSVRGRLATDVWPTDIWPTDVWPTGLFTDRHLADRTFGRQDIRPTGKFSLIDRRRIQHRFATIIVRYWLAPSWSWPQVNHSQHGRVHSIDRYRKEIGVDVLSGLFRSRSSQNTLENPRVD